MDLLPSGGREDLPCYRIGRVWTSRMWLDRKLCPEKRMI